MSIKTPGQLAYEADCQRNPPYHDGTTRKAWDQLCDAAKWSWERNPKPREYADTLIVEVITLSDRDLRIIETVTEALATCGLLNRDEQYRFVRDQLVKIGCSWREATEIANDATAPDDDDAPLGVTVGGSCK